MGFNSGAQSSEWTVFSLTGQEDSAKNIAAVEFQRLANDLNQPEPDPASRQQRRFFAVDFFSTDQSDILANHREPQLINFPLEKDALAEKMRIEIEDIYAVNGLSAARSLLAAIEESKRHHISDLSDVRSSFGSVYTNPTKFSSPEEVYAAGMSVRLACDDALGALLKKSKQAVQSIEAKAAELAKPRLCDALNEIKKETPRYIHSNDAHDSSRESLLKSDTPSSQIILRGPDLAPLIGALRRIEERRTAVETASSKKTFSNKSTNLGEAASALALTVSVECRAFPVLYRIWNDNRIPNSVRFGVLPNGEAILSASNAEGGTAIAKLTDSLWKTLRNSYQSNYQFAKDIEGRAALVWRYPPLIEAALAALHFNDPSVEFQAAQERMEEEEGMELTTELSMISGAMEGGAALLAAAPEVMLALAASTLVLNATDSLQNYLKKRQEERAFNCVLDPKKALASDPSYTGLVLNVAASLLDIKGFSDALRSARYAGQIKNVETALEVLSP